MKAIFSLVFITMSLFSQAQCPGTNPNCNTASNWVLGEGVLLTFKGDSVITDTLDFLAPEASSSISDLDGNLLFYSNPEQLFDLSGNVVTVKGHSSSAQGSLLLKHIDDSMYHFLSTDDVLGSQAISLYYNHFIDLDSFRTENKIVLNLATEQLNASSHRNNRDVWIASHHSITDSFYVFLVKKQGMLCCPRIIEAGDSYHSNSVIYTVGSTLKFSPAGEYLCSQMSTAGKFQLFRFDNEIGQLEHWFSNKFGAPWSAEFSPDGSKLYISQNRVFQYDLNQISVGSILSSRTALNMDWNDSIGPIQLGPDGKIYVSKWRTNHLDVITYPNREGINCGYDSNAITLNHGVVQNGLPNFNQSYFYTPSIDFAYTEDCWNHNYQFEGRDTINANSWKWYFQKGSVKDSVLTKHCNYVFPDTGRWTVSHIAKNGSRSDTVTKVLTIRQRFRQDVLGRDTFYCKGDSFRVVLRSPKDMHCVHWDGEEPNLDSIRGKIIDYDHFHVDSLVADTAGVYSIKLTNKTFCQAWDTITIYEDVRPVKPSISKNSGNVASTVESHKYRWFISDTLYLDTTGKALDPLRNGYYQVQLLSEHGCESEKSDSFLVDFAQVPQMTGPKINFNVYPNPSSGNFEVEVDAINFSIEIYDMRGKLILKQINKTDFNLHVSGNYYIRLVSEKGTGRKLITVN